MFRHQQELVSVSPCQGRDAVSACTAAGGHGGEDGIGDPVPRGMLSADTAICIAASEGMTPGLSRYEPLWDPNRNGDPVWEVMMIQEEHCSPDQAGGQGDAWQIDGRTGEILSYGVLYYSAAVCVYGEPPR